MSGKAQSFDVEHVDGPTQLSEAAVRQETRWLTLRRVVLTLLAMVFTIATATRTHIIPASGVIAFTDLNSAARLWMILQQRDDGPLLNIDPLQTSIGEIKRGLAEERFSVEDVVKAYLDNMERNNIKGLDLRAIIYVAPREQLLEMARKADDEIKQAKQDVEAGGSKVQLGPLHGIPVVVKDCIDTDAEYGMPTSAGNFALAESVVPGDAEVVKRLRAAGAIIIGKANLQELVGFKATIRGINGSDDVIGNSGWSATGGQGSSAYVWGGFDMGGDPGGSSSGSAVAVSAGMAVAALGTDTTGSITYPCSRAALYCLRPSLGLVPTEGVVPLSNDLDTVGPMAQTAADVGIILDVLTNQSTKYTKAANQPLKWSDVRIGYLPSIINGTGLMRYPNSTCTSEIHSASYRAIDNLRVKGARMISLPALFPSAPAALGGEGDHEDLQAWKDASGVFSRLIEIGMGDAFPKYLITRSAGEGQRERGEEPIRTLRDLVEYNDRHADVELPPKNCCQENLLSALLAPLITSPQYTATLRRSGELFKRDMFDRMFTDYTLDLLIAPADSTILAGFAACAGYVAGTVPLYQCEEGSGLPFGMAVYAREGHEELVLSTM